MYSHVKVLTYSQKLSLSHSAKRCSNTQNINGMASNFPDMSRVKNMFHALKENYREQKTITKPNRFMWGNIDAAASKKIIGWICHRMSRHTTSNTIICDLFKYMNSCIIQV